MTVEKDWTAENGSVLGDSSVGVFTSNSNSGVIGKDGTNTVYGPAGTPTGRERIGIRYKTNQLEAMTEGVFGTSGSFVNTLPIVDYLEIAKDAPCNIRDIAIWNQRQLTDIETIEVLNG